MNFNSLSEWKDLINLPRGYIINFIHSTVGGHFREWIHYRFTHQNESIKKPKNENIQIDPKIAQIFQ